MFPSHHTEFSETNKPVRSLSSLGPALCFLQWRNAIILYYKQRMSNSYEVNFSQLGGGPLWSIILRKILEQYSDWAGKSARHKKEEHTNNKDFLFENHWEHSLPVLLGNSLSFSKGKGKLFCSISWIIKSYLWPCVPLRLLVSLASFSLVVSFSNSFWEWPGQVQS